MLQYPSAPTPLTKRTRYPLLVGLLCILLSSPAWAQPPGSRPASQPATTHRISLPHLYRHFLAFQNHLDRVAAELDKQGKDGSGLRNHFQQTLGFDDSQFGAVRETALTLEAKLKDQDAKAKAIIDATRAKYPRALHSPADLPPVPPELVQLQRERDSIIEEQVAALKAKLGATPASTLDAFLEHHFAPTVTVNHVGPPRPHNPAHHPLPPFPREVQP
ncbi:MAG: hypothetical protein ACLQGV_16140 [Bryobacteraceae bacterium]